VVKGKIHLGRAKNLIHLDRAKHSWIKFLGNLIHLDRAKHSWTKLSVNLIHLGKNASPLLANAPTPDSYLEG
jgi:hypothetical protein